MSAGIIARDRRVMAPPRQLVPGAPLHAPVYLDHPFGDPLTGGVETLQHLALELRRHLCVPAVRLDRDLTGLHAPPADQPPGDSGPLLGDVYADVQGGQPGVRRQQDLEPGVGLIAPHHVAGRVALGAQGVCDGIDERDQPVGEVPFPLRRGPPIVEAHRDMVPRPPGAVYGKVIDSHRAFLGIESADLSAGGGALVYSTAAGGPAAKAGLRAGDIITAVDGQPTPSAGALAAVLAGLKPGQTVPVNVTHQDGSPSTVQVTLGQLPG